VSFGARALIRLGALRHNLEVIRAAAPQSRVMAVIKANAYGHGMLAVAQHLQDVDAFAVARIPEAIELRENGIEAAIVLLSGVLDSKELQTAMQRQFELVVHCREQIELLDSCTGSPLTIWLKLDTGMNRLGFLLQDSADVLQRLNAMSSVREVRLMTHLASADELENPLTDEQLQRFRSMADGFDGAVSIANSPGILGWPAVASPHPKFAGDIWIRPGIALYGISPFADKTGLDLGLKPVMQFEARLIAVKPLQKGARVGYKGRFESATDTTLGIISAGYGDGYARQFRDGTPVLINGRRVPLVGNVSMDMMAVDLGPDCKDAIGDIVTLWGDGLAVEEVAEWANAIPYELVCGVSNREASEVVN
jgi:alanine racemase